MSTWLNPFAKPFYKSKAWQQCRAGYIKSVNGWCERCIAKNKYVKGYIVHHKTYITEDNISDPMITLNWKNLEYLCHNCHNKEHFGSNEAIREGLAFDAEGNLIQT